MRSCIFGLQPAEGASSATNCGPPPPGGCGPPIAARLIRHNKPAAERMGLHERTCGTRKCSPPPGGGCGMRRLLYEAANSEFKIQNSELQTRGAACGGPVRSGPAGSISLADSPWHCFGSSGWQPAAADFRRDILQQTRLRSSRQPAAAPPGGGLQSRAARKQALPPGCGPALWQGSTAKEAELPPPGCGPPGPAPAPRTVCQNGRFGLRQPARPHRRSTKRQRDHPIAPTRL